MYSLTKQLGVFFIRYRVALILGLNAVSASLGFLLALGLRFDFEPQEIFSTGRFWLPVAILITCRNWAYLLFDLNHGYWRYASVHDLVRILKAHALSSLLFVACLLILRIESFPRSVIFLEFFLSIILSGGSRLAVRLFSERFFDIAATSKRASRNVVVIGAGDSGHLVVKNLLSNKRIGYYPSAVLDDSERAHGSTVFGVPVVGRLSDLEKALASDSSISGVIIAIPTLSKDREEDIKLVCSKFEVALKKLQSFEDIACADALSPQEGLSIESVLEKEKVIEHEAEIRDALRGKRVLVTGAGGSIGSEIVRQLLRFSPSSVILFDNSEYNLFQLSRELDDVSPEIQVRRVLGSICDSDRLRSTFAEFRPHYVFHAAAYKHVPLMEENTYQAFRNNILGTRNVLDCSSTHGVERVVLISTDKAVQPSSIMGASKRVAELLARYYSTGTLGTSLNVAAVRFGNVINSSGSVIPIFKQQILSGGPLTVTHPDMERFFMSIREAVRLVLTAGILGDRGDIFVLDMGKPIKVVDVARKMLALYGRRDIEIIYSGIRPGEKLTEELVSDTETLGETPFKKVGRVTSDIPKREIEAIFDWVISTEKHLPELSDAELRDSLLGQFSPKLEQLRTGTAPEIPTPVSRTVPGQNIQVRPS